ncbi:MAG: hypothetical protein ABSF52_23950 [Syntrophobacteraceae bacterium]|jgi:hypothetical protein
MARLVYVVLSIGDFPGMVNKLFALPWKAFEFHATEHKLVLNVDKEKLKTAHGFEKGDK